MVVQKQVLAIKSVCQFHSDMRKGLFQQGKTYSMPNYFKGSLGMRFLLTALEHLCCNLVGAAAAPVPGEPGARQPTAAAGDNRLLRLPTSTENGILFLIFSCFLCNCKIYPPALPCLRSAYLCLADWLEEGQRQPEFHLCNPAAQCVHIHGSSGAEHKPGVHRTRMEHHSGSRGAV